MQKIISLFVLCFSLLFFQTTYALGVSPVGYWKTIDDVTNQPKAILQIWESKDQHLFGRILKIYPSPGHDQNEVCAACVGEKHNKRIVGMVIMENLKQDQDDPNTWVKGQILDPKNGKTYHCKIRVIENGQKLNARGYIGLPLFGRTQTWLRVSSL